MTLQYSNQPSGDRRRGSFIRWSGRSCRQDKPALSDPGFVIDRRQLYKYLDSLEGFSGE